MGALLFFLVIPLSGLLLALLDGGAGARPGELERALGALLGKTMTCAGATLFFLGMKRALFRDFDILKVIRGQPPFSQHGEDVPRAAYIVGWCLLYGATLTAFAWGGAY